MRLLEFINHIKHKSLLINVFGFSSAKTYYIGTIGEYMTSVTSSKINNNKIGKIEPVGHSLNIYIFEGDLK